MDAHDWDERYRTKPLVWSAEPNQFLRERIAGLPVGRALDLATGEGRNALWLASQGWDVTAVDFSPVGLDKARALAAHQNLDVDWVLADLTTWKPPDRYDLVLVFYLHVPGEHLARIHTTASAAVAPGGRLIIVGHDLDNLTHGSGGPQSPDVLHTVDSLTAAAADLDVIEARQVERPTEAGTALDTILVADRSET